ncbi:hypothetical protein BDU57DRAFT_543635 [Ampelomyces quisqualis]|uniref:Uncharacterized protein n=1 Tax=Ampelomyces quisqualis TaxID=50730 RepID=A0A6A5Q871_AMPQU|nr:hypothetical protein BDU57DRAFT_543635 [Ampelomyces quisqualis]
MPKRNYGAIDDAAVQFTRSRPDAAPLQPHPTCFSFFAPSQMAFTPMAPSFCYWPPLMSPHYPWSWSPLMPFAPMMYGQMHMLPSDSIMKHDEDPLFGGEQHADHVPNLPRIGDPVDNAGFWRTDDCSLDHLINPQLNASFGPMTRSLSGREPEPDPLADLGLGPFIGRELGGDELGALEVSPELALMDHNQSVSMADVNEGNIEATPGRTSRKLTVAFDTNTFNGLDHIPAFESLLAVDHLFDTTKDTPNDTSPAPSSMTSAFDFLDDNSGDAISPTPNLEQLLAMTATPQSLPFYVEPPTLKTPCPSPNNTTIQWYNRFYHHPSYHVNPATITLISTEASALLTSLSTSTDSVPATYAKYVVFMTTLHPNYVTTKTVLLVMHLFLYIADTPDACLWSTNTRPSSQYFKKGVAGLEADWYDAIRPHLPTPTHRALATRDTFIKSLKGWRRIGSCYAFLAQRLGLGALLCARELLHPWSMWGCARGRDKYGASERALRYLEEVVKIRELAETSGAERVMNGLMWDVFGAFGEGVLGGEGENKLERGVGEAEVLVGEGRGPFPGFGRGSVELGMETVAEE